MKKTLKISKCAHNTTFDGLQKWYRSSFEQLGWMILALKFGYKDKVQVYKQNTLMLREDKKKTIYCYSEQEKQTAVSELGATHEITRFMGLGEISAGEFKDFIGENIRLDPLTLNHLHNSDELLTFFMGKNTPERQDFIIGNLRIEKDLVAV